MKNLYFEIVKILKRKENFAVVTIWDNVVLASHTTGAKMIVLEDGSIIGTIGGGQLESDAISLAKESLSLNQTIIKSFDLTHKSVTNMDTISEGKGEMLIEFMDSNDENNLIVYSEVLKILDKKDKAWLITVLDNISVVSQHCLVKPDKTLIGKLDCDPYILEKLIAGPAKIAIHAEAFDKQRFIAEPLRPAGTVYIFGAGILSQRIALLSENVGFRTVVLDDSSNYANPVRFPTHTKIKVVDSFNKLPDLEIDSDSYLVIVTRGHLYDKIVLEQVLRSNAKYLGMIGGRGKLNKIFNELLNKGYIQEELNRVHAPIGTNINAETPEELAVSIVGELIQVRAEGENMNYKQKSNTSSTCCKIITPDIEV